MSEKEKAIAEMNVSSATAAKLLMTLRFQGDSAAAERVEKIRNEIIRQTEDLLAKAMQAWTADTISITAEIAVANREIEDAINDIKKKIKTVENVGKAIGKLEDIIVKAQKYLVAACG